VRYSFDIIDRSGEGAANAGTIAKGAWQYDKWPCRRQCLAGHTGRMDPRSRTRLVTRLRVARAELDLSQEQLGRVVGVSRQTISSIETGQYCPSTLLALRLAQALGEPVERLFWLEGETDAQLVRP
jgi:putative transcriptional regulator